MPKTPNMPESSQTPALSPKQWPVSDTASIDGSGSQETMLPKESINQLKKLEERKSRLTDPKSDGIVLALLAQKLADSPDSFFGVLAANALNLFSAGSVFIILSEGITGSRGTITAAGAWKDSGLELAKELEILCGSVIADGEPALFQKPHRTYSELKSLKPPIKEALLAPIRIGKKVGGVFGVVFHDKGRTFDSEDLRLLHSFCSFAAVAGLLATPANKMPAPGGSNLEVRSVADQKASDERFARFMQNLPGLAWIKDEKGRYVYVNDTAATTFGRPVGEILGKTDTSIFPKTTARSFIENDRRALKSESGIQTEEILRDPSGVLRHSLVTKFPIPDPDNEDVMIGGMAIDITERRQIEKDQAFLFTIAEMIRLKSDIVSLLTDIASAVGRYMDVEKCFFFERFGDKNTAAVVAEYSRSGIGKEKTYDLTGYSAVMLDIMAAGRTVVNRNSETDPRTAKYFETTYGPNGEISYIAVPMMRQSEWIAGFCCTDSMPRNWTDLEISLFEAVGERAWGAVERIRAESALRESEERFREMADSLPLSVWMHDRNGEHEFVNRKFGEFFGVTFQETQAKGWQELLHPDDKDAYTSKFVSAVENRTSFHAEARARTAGGEWRWIESWGQPRFSDSGEFLGIIGASADINDRKAAMDAVRESEARLAFALDIGNYGTWDINFTDGSMIWSDKLFEIFGLAPAKGGRITLEQFEEIVHPDDIDWISELTRLSIEHRHDYAAEYRIHRRDTGGLRWISAAARFLYDENGTAVRCVGIAKDITDRKINEDLLRASQERFMLAQNAGNVGIWDWNSTGQMYWSDKMWELYGESPQGKTLTDEFWKEKMHPEDRDRITEVIKNALGSGLTDFRDEFRIIRKRGEVRWIEVIANIERDRSGRAARMYGVNLDITDKKDSAERLKASEFQMRTITDTLPALISYIGADERYRFVNKRYSEWFGKPQEQIVGRKMRSVLGARAYEAFKPSVDEALRGVTSSFDTWAHYKGAGRRYVHVSYVPEMDENGRALGFYVLVTDLTEQRRSEDLLRSSEERMRVLSDSFTDYAIISTDIEGRIETWNPGAANIFGFEEDEILGEPIDVLFTPEDVMKGMPLREMRNARQTGKSVDERWHVRKDGSRFFASGVMAPLYIGDTLSGYAKIASDLTEKKRNSEALQRAHDEMEVRVAERTHELAGMNEVLLSEINERKTAERQKIELLQRIVSTQEDERRRIARDLHDQLGQRLTALRLKLASLKDACGDNEDLVSRAVRLQQIAERLDSEISFLTWELRPTALDELGLVEAIHTFVKEWSRHYGVEAEFHASGMIDAGFPGNAEIQLYRIVQEALNNIVKYASATRVGVILERTGDTATLIIEDNGVGFDPAINNHPERTFGGVGIAGMHERAELIGGKLEIETQIGQGTSIYVRVPLKPRKKR